MWIYIRNMEVNRNFYNRISRTHELARELKNRPDDFVTVTVGNREYSIESIKTVTTHANIDDGVTHKTLICNEMYGNLR